MFHGFGIADIPQKSVEESSFCLLLCADYVTLGLNKILSLNHYTV